MTFLPIALLSCALSIACAYAAEGLAHSVPVLGSFASLTLSHNPGIAFGVRLPSPLQELLIGTALIAVVITAFRTHQKLPLIAFGLIVGGAAANIIDRLRDGVVTDYFRVGTFPIFNMADSCITIGAALLILDALLHSRKKQPSKR